MLKHKTSLNKFKIEIIPSIFSDYNAFKLEINWKKEVKKPTNMWSLNNVLLKTDWVKEIKGEIDGHMATNDNDSTTYQNFWDAAKAVIRGTFISLQTCLKKQ